MGARLSNLKPILKLAYPRATHRYNESEKISGVMQKIPFFVLGGVLLLTAATTVYAQPRGGHDGPPGGEFPRDGRGPDGNGPRRGPRAAHRLMGLWHELAAMENGKAPLSSAQAGKIVALVLPVSKKSTLSDADSKTLADKIEAVLTDAQRAQLRDQRPPRDGNGPPPRDGDGPPPRDGRGPRDGGPRGDGPPPPRDGNGPPRDGRGPRDGGPRGDGPPPRPGDANFEKTRAFMDALNPFYPPTGYASWKGLPTDFQKDVAKRYGERRALLEALSRKAKGK